MNNQFPNYPSDPRQMQDQREMRKNTPSQNTASENHKQSLPRRLINGWFALTSPPMPVLKASLHEWESYRRGRLASITLLILFIIVFSFMLSIFKISNTNLFIFNLSGIVLLLLMITIAQLNRFGFTQIAAILMAFVINAGIAVTLLSVSGGLGLINLPLFDVLIASELIIVSLLTPEYVFVVMIINIIFTVLDIVFERHAPDLTNYIRMSGGLLVIIRPVTLEIIVALVSYLWVRSALRAIQRADKAEAVAQLQQTIAEQEHLAAQQKLFLERSIQYLVDTQRKVANGDFNARVPLTNDNILWQVAGSFNNLLSRFQRLRQDSIELQKVQQDLPRLAAAIREIKKGRAVDVGRGGTVLDLLIMELNSTNHF